MIQEIQNPENHPTTIKFLSLQNEGMRGVVLAKTENGKQAIVLALNSSIDGSIKWGNLYLIKETNPNYWAKTVRLVSKIPDQKNWTVSKLLLP